ncbi:hypothetical protein HY404_01555 [Candidatus Microgenomates bacterium]|nr:hypothetical protein [Candidatus Microgenomates bacterium]
MILQLSLLAALLTFFFGFGAGALIHWYLIHIKHSLVKELRGSLTFVSSIIGDGILLPIINAICVAFLLHNFYLVSQPIISWSLIISLTITLGFHIFQAKRGLVNWTMPKAWQWNILGLFHAIYMFTVITLLALFYLTVRQFSSTQSFPTESILVTGGVVLFIILLKLDYREVKIFSN